MANSQWVVQGNDVTKAQFDAYERLVDRWNEVPKVTMGWGSDKYLGCQFKTIFIGIEVDGFAHS